MKCLLLNYEYPPLGGGAGNATKEIARALSLGGHHVDVVTTHYRDLPEFDNSEGFGVYRLKSIRKNKDRSSLFEMLHYVFKAIFFTKKLVKEKKPDSIIAFFALPTGLVAYYLFKKYDIPYAISLRGGDVPGFLANELKWHHRLSAPLTKIVWKNASHIVANSKGLQNLAQKTAQPLGKKVEYIPNGVDIKIYTPPQEHSNNLGGNKILKVLFVGRLVPQKRVHLALEALAGATKRMGEKTKIIFTIIGDGPLRKDLEKQTETLGIKERVHFLGWLDREKIIDEYRKHDVFLIPSSEEGMPNVVLEAMASGLAIIATDIPGTNELVKNEGNGFLVQDSNDISNAIVTLSSNKTLVSEFKKASRLGAEKFGWDKVAQAYVDLITK